jgi:hypothetical protein
VDVSAHSRHMVQGFQRQGVLLLLDRHGVATDAEFGVEWSGVEWSDLTAANNIVNLTGDLMCRPSWVHSWSIEDAS